MAKLDLSPEPHRLLAGALFLDSLVHKVDGANVVVRRAEGQLLRALTATLIRRAKVGIARARELVIQSGTTVDEREIQGILDAVEDSFKGWGEETRPLVTVAMEEIYRTGKRESFDLYSKRAKAQPYTGVKKAAKKPPKEPKAPKPEKVPKHLEIKPKFDLVDKNAVDAMANHQVFWINDAYSKAMSKAVAGIAKDVLLKQGLSATDAAKELEDKLSKSFGYNVAKPHEGKLPIPGSWKGTGIQYLEGVAANAATTARMAGSIKAFTELGITKYTIVNPADERTCTRCSGMNGRTFEVQHAAKQITETLTAKTPEQIKDIHPWPSDKDFVKVVGSGSKGDPELNKKIAAKGWSVPPIHYKCRCTIDISEDTEFIPEEVKAETKEGEFPWSEPELTKVNKQLNGMHEKSVYKDPLGDQWIFKPQQDFRALTDLTAAQMAQLFGRETAEVYLTKLGGRGGSIQKMFSGVLGDMYGATPSTLKKGDIASLEQEHAFDWLISQHDTHAGNVLRHPDGLKFIDKGQAFRFFGKDRLHYQYGGGGDPNPAETYYHTIFKDYAEGKDVKIGGMKSLDAFIKKVESVSDEDFLRVLKPYASAAAAAAREDPGMKRFTWMGRYTEEQFIAGALARKNSMRSDFERFYKELEDARNKALGKDKPAKVPALPKGDKSRAGVLRESLEVAKRSGWKGRSLFVKGSDYEDMNLLLYGTEGDGTFLETKLRAAADRRLTKMFGLGAEDSSKQRDVYFTEIVNIAKSFNAGKKYGLTEADLKYLTEMAGDYHKALSKDAASGDGMGVYYKKYIERFYDPKTKKILVDSSPGILDPYSPPADEPKKGLVPPGWKVEVSASADPIKRQIKDGKIHATVEQFATRLDLVTDSYRIQSPDGLIEIYYRPHTGAIAGQGQFKVWFNRPIENLSEADLEKGFARLKEIGLETEFASKKDLELMYLRKLSYKLKLDQKTNKEVPETLDTDEQIKGLRDVIGKKVEIPSDAGPTFDRKDQQGWARWMAPVSKESEGLGLYHSLSGGIVGGLKAIVEGKTNAMIPTLDKLRVGIPLIGMSPDEDLKTGGASYFFTRIRRADEKRLSAGLLFKRELLHDMGAVTYESDRYGSMAEEDLKTRKVPSDWQKIAQRGQSDETIFKHDVDLEKWLDKIIVTTESARKQAIDMFKANGINEFAGKKVEDLVVYLRPSF